MSHHAEHDASAVPGGPAGNDPKALPRDTAQLHKAILLETTADGKYVVGFVHPDRGQDFEAVRRALGVPRSSIVKRQLAEDDYDSRFEQTYNKQEETHALSAWVTNTDAWADVDGGDDVAERTGAQIVEEEDQDWVIKDDAKSKRDQVLNLCASSVLIRASDLHFTPYGKYGLVQPRVDGRLLPPDQCRKYQKEDLEELQRALISKTSNSYTDIIQVGGDGKFYMRIGGRLIQCRLSIAKTVSGLDFCIRFNDFQITNIDNLGLEPRQARDLRRASHRDRGINFFVGPTGSGKSVAQQATLAEGDRMNLGIFEIGDPIENRVFGRTQIEISLKITWEDAYARGLRHDPDWLIAGEVRTPEQAEKLFQGVTSGHLIMTTLHVSSAAETPKRLCDLGLKPYQIANSINCVHAQRLVPRLCLHCRRPDFAHPGEYVAQEDGCPQCIHRGYYKRVPVAEVLIPDKRISGLIYDAAPPAEIEAAARANGMITLHEAAAMKIVRGVTSREAVEHELGELDEETLDRVRHEFALAA